MAISLQATKAFFRICIIEDTVALRKLAEMTITNKFKKGGYASVLTLVVDPVTTYADLLEVHAKRIQEGYYQVVLVDNDLSLYPDAPKQEGCIKGVEFVASLVKNAAICTYFIMNSSNNSELVCEKPEFEQIYHLIPSRGKNQGEAFNEINALFLDQAVAVCPTFEQSSEGTPSPGSRLSSPSPSPLSPPSDMNSISPSPLPPFSETIKRSMSGELKEMPVPNEKEFRHG